MAGQNKEFDKCGPFQYYHAALTQFTRFSFAWTASLMMFGNYDPGWTCLEYHSNQNASLSESLLNSTSNTEFRSEDINSSNLLHNFSLDNLGEDYNNGSMCDSLRRCAVIDFNPSAKTIVTEFNLICDQSYIPSVIISIQMVGMLIGAFVCGQLGEILGRKIVLYASTVLMSVACFLAIFSPSWQVYSAFMFVNGFGGAGVMGICGLYSMEFLQPKWRARLAALPIYNVAMGSFAVAILLLRHWVYVHIATACLGAFSCIGFFWSPESLRWLLVHGRMKEAGRVIEKINRVNKRTLDIDGVIETHQTLSAHRQGERKYTYLDLFKSRDVCLNNIKLSIVSFLVLMTYGSLAYSVKSLAGDFYVNALIAGFSEFPTTFIIAPAMNLLGRRMSLALFLFLGTSGNLTVVVAHYTMTESAAALVTRYGAFLLKAFILICYNISLVCTVELFPTAVRNVGVAFANAAGRLGSITAPYLIPRDQSSTILCFTVLGLGSLVNMAVVLSLPETMNKPLQDSLTNRTVQTKGSLETVKLDPAEEELNA